MGEPKQGDCFYFLLISPQILIPALMVTAEKDFVLTPELSKHMEDWVREVRVIGASWQRAQVSQRMQSGMLRETACLIRPSSTVR